MAKINLGKVVPEKGVDYYTTEEKNELKAEIEQEIDTSKINPITKQIQQIKQEQNTQNTDISNLKQATQTNANDITDIKNEQTEQNSKITDLEKEVEILSETIDSELEDGTATGESITVNDSARAKAELDVGGNTEQKQYEGRNYLPQPEEQSFTNAGVTVKSNSDGSYSIKGTPTASFNVVLPIKEVVLPTSAYIHLRNKGTVTYNATCILRENNTDYGSFAFGTLNRIINKDTQEETHINQVVFYGNNDLVGTDIDITCQPSVELTNQTTDYEPYVGGQASPNPEYPQEVQVVKGSNTIKINNKNLFDKSQAVLGYRLAQNGKGALDGDYYVSPYIKVKPNTTYTKNSPIADSYHRFAFYSSNSDSTTISISSENTTTTPENCNYLRFCGLQSELDTAQLELGSTATYYAEHEEQTLTLTLPEGMEMCKIGDYEDGFVKDLDTGKWYKKEIIEKDVLDGNEVWNKNTGTGYEGVYYSPNKSFVANLGFCDIYSRFNNYNAHDYAFNTNGGAIVIKNKDIETIADFKNALKNKNATTYFVRINPQLIEITDETLISQLDKLYEVITYYGQTNVTCEGDGLSPIFTLNYKKSNRLRLENIENRLALLE